MNIKGYFQESYTELMHKVTWPTWSELQNSAVLVMVSFPDICPDSGRHGFYLQQGNAIYLQFVILTGKNCNE